MISSRWQGPAIDLATLLPLCAALALIAGLYGSVGQAGASSFLAVIRFARAGHFSWPLLRPFLLLSMPAAFLGVLLLIAGLPFLGITRGAQMAAAFMRRWRAGSRTG